MMGMRSMKKMRLVIKHPAVLDLKFKFCFRIQTLTSWKKETEAEHGGSFG